MVNNKCNCDNKTCSTCVGFIRFCFDDRDEKYWEFSDIGYITESDYEIDCERYPLQIEFIENHDMFDEWKAKCPNCRSSEEQCECSNEFAEPLAKNVRTWNQFQHHFKGRPRKEVSKMWVAYQDRLPSTLVLVL